MEWNRAKNIILIFFVLLNVVLAFFMLSERRRYTVTSEDEAMIRNILAQHNITLEADMIRRFPHMRALLMSGFYYDEDMLIDILFQDTADITREENIWGISITDGQAMLMIADGFASFYAPYGLGRTPQAFIAQHFPDFIQDERFLPHDDLGQRMIFRQVYRGHMVYSNNIEFLVADTGFVEIVMQFGIIHGWDGLERPIFAPDEALITFLQRVQLFTRERDPVTIWHMDIVYFTEFDNVGLEHGSVHHAVPFYRIFTREFDMPFLINAYLNVSIDV